MSTKISGGVFRGRIIESPEGDSTRPTSNKIRQAMFSTLGQNMAGVTSMMYLPALVQWV